MNPTLSLEDFKNSFPTEYQELPDDEKNNQSLEFQLDSTNAWRGRYPHKDGYTVVIRLFKSENLWEYVL